MKYLGVDAEVGQRSQFGEKRLSVGLHSTFNVPVEPVGLGVWVQQAERDLITCGDGQQSLCSIGARARR